MIRALVLALCATPLAAQDAPLVPRMADETAAAGIAHIFQGEWEYMVGGGVATFDCSGDGKPEVFLAGGSGAAALYLNRSPTGGALAFAPVQSGLEVAAVTGAYPLDVDGDGITDLALLRVGENILMRGLGDCRFENANAAWGFDGGDGWTTAFAATWEAGQQWPTLAVGNYIDRREDAFPWGSCTDNWLHRPASAGFAPPLPLTPSHCALSMLFTDWDRTGTPDLRVSNDREYYKGGQEQMWRIDPGADPVLWTEAEGWARLRIWGMGIASHDLTGDGFPEYFLTSMADNRLQTLASIPTDGTPPRPAFDDIAYPLGVIAQRPYTGGEIYPSTAWHAQFEDVNNDGPADLFIAKGNVWEMPDFALRDPDNLLLQRADGTFEEAGDRAGVGDFRTGRGAMLADLNLDGWVDLVVVNRHEPAAVYRNMGTGADVHWLQVILRQDGPNRDGIGAWVEVRAGDTVIWHEITIGGGHVSGHLGWRHIGLGAAEAAEVRVLWPDGTQGDWQPVAADLFPIQRQGVAPEVWHPPA